MEHDFWHARWEQNQIGFHLDEANPRLVSHSAVLPPPTDARILVPLCGKSLDMVWLAQRGYKVIGVELSRRAAEAFAQEQGIEASVEHHGPFVCYRMPNIDVLCGDFLALTPEQLGPVHGYYDRGALVALPPAMRADYAAKLKTLMPRGARGLLITFDYTQQQMQGPPFAIPQQTVRELYAPAFTLEQLATYDVLDAEPRFRAAGLTSLTECVYALERT